jgi:hypothetical protein
MKQKSVCISPIDWGLGHATRCIQLIRALETLEFKIYIASEGPHEALLKEAIPTATFLHLRGYRVRYTKKRALLIPALILQLPKIIYAVVNEYSWLQKTHKKYNFDLIISDNRFGFFNQKTKSVFITHQLELQTPFFWSTKLIQKITYSFINKYSACWVADSEGSENLSGVLSNPSKLPSVHLWYMNCLSRFQNQASLISKTSSIQFLGMVSGPEPQRTLLENILWQQGNELDVPFVIVAGLPKQKLYNKITAKGALYHHLEVSDLVQQIVNAEYIICRGGYTTLMELIPFKKKLIFVPTPGQTEQEFLARYWQTKNWSIYIDQASFNLASAIDKASKLNYQSPPYTPFSSEALSNELKRLSL